MKKTNISIDGKKYKATIEATEGWQFAKVYVVGDKMPINGTIFGMSRDVKTIIMPWIITKCSEHYTHH